ncbi:MAG: NADH:ubiquinone oxidoreductase chain M [Candidatus Methanohalarchaeum thermophilum]|uniref:NADH:ubiquinone oxidoreductase chain M n=1 Tax=Methanohalarchaeum thermophilum TaxID=1903181 RepID=A0A1Q6DUU3_METT1|nr:MAG: NADH:ubiquinone oxidoreductase chain M [Candidatus Methanohalarchaeum thermophilum]
MFGSSDLLILVVLVPLITAYFLPLCGYIRSSLCNLVSVFSLSISLIISLYLAKIVVLEGTIQYFTTGFQPPFAIEIRADQLTVLMVLATILLSLLTVIYSRYFIRGRFTEERKGLYYALILLLAGGLNWFIIAADIFNMFVGLEILSISSYTLIGISQKRKAIISGFKYLLMGAIGSSFTLLGIGYLYIMTGTLNFNDLALRIIELNLMHSEAILASLAFIVTGLSIKSAIFPLHVWMPDAYSEALVPICALSSGIIVEAAVYMLIRIIYTVYGTKIIMEIVPITTIFLYISGIAIILGSFFAISQTNIKRMLAYSSVSQMGYIILGVGISTKLGLSAGFLHLFNHTIMKACLFFAVGGVVYRKGITEIYEFRGIGKKMPWTMTFFSIAALSIIGVPPTNGFVSKFLLAYASLDAEKWFFAIIILISSLLNAVYFFKIINISFFSGKKEEEKDIKEPPKTILIPTGILAILCIIIGFAFPIPLSMIETAIKSLIT